MRLLQGIAGLPPIFPKILVTDLPNVELPNNSALTQYVDHLQVASSNQENCVTLERLYWFLQKKATRFFPAKSHREEVEYIGSVLSGKGGGVV